MSLDSGWMLAAILGGALVAVLLFAWRRNAEVGRLRHSLDEASREMARADRELAELRASPPPKAAAAASVAPPPAPATQRATDEQSTYAEMLAEELTGWENVGDRLDAAFANDEFCLYAQAIEPVDEQSGRRTMQEILVRLKEEEENLMPPGAFLPLVERFGMLGRLDRWVTTRVLDWIAQDRARRDGIYSVNVSAVTLHEPAFSQFVVESLRARGLPGSVLCFEFTEAAVGNEAEANRFVASMHQAGCNTALSQFGRSELSFRLLKVCRPSFLKIDGNIVLNMLRDRVALAKIKAIAQVSRTVGAATVAELVEDPQTLAALRTAGVDYAQGFGIARPRPIEELETVALR